MQERQLLQQVLYVLRDAWPLMVAELLPSLASLVDMVFVSPMGDWAVAAVGVGGYTSWLLGVSLTVFYIGGLVAVSQAIGAGMHDRARELLSEAFSAAVLLAASVAGLGMLAAQPLALLLAGSRGIAGAAADYLQARLLGLPGFAALLVLDAGYRAASANRGILVANTVSALVNAALDPVLIKGLGMGVAGAGFATAASYYAGAIVLLARLEASTGMRLTPCLPGGNTLLILRVGAPAMVERGLFAVGHGFYLGVVARCGKQALAAHSLGIRVESMAFLPAFALSTYASSLVGSRIGADRVEEAWRAGWRTTLASMFFMSFMGILLAAASPLAAMLAPSRESKILTIAYLLMAAASEPLLGEAMVLAGAIRGAGNTLIPTIVNLGGLYAFRVAPSLVLAERIQDTPVCAPVLWLVMDIDIGLRAIIFAVIYSKFFHRLARRVV